MEGNESQQYTFSQEEKEILVILALFERNLGERAQNVDRKIKYYSNFTFNGKHIEGFENIFIVIEKDKNGKVLGYNVYRSDMKKIFSFDNNGNIIESIERLDQIIGKIDIIKLIEENDVIDIDENGKEQSRLKGTSENIRDKETEKVLEETNDSQDKKENSNKQEQVEQDDETQKIENDLKKQGENLRLSKYRKITDTNISNMMSEVFDGTMESGIAFSNELNRFVIISKVGGHYQVNKKVEPARLAWNTIVSVDPEGKKVETKVPYALMKVPDEPKKEIAVTLDQYGDPSIETVDVFSAQRRIGMKVKMENDKPQNGNEKYVNYTMDKEGRNLPNELAEKAQRLKDDYGVTEIDFDQLKDLDIDALIEEEAERVKLSKVGFEGYLKKASGKTLQEKICNAQEDIIQEYMGNKRPR